MKQALRALLDDLDRIEAIHGEVTDTDVREQISAAVSHGFIASPSDYKLPQEFGMFRVKGDHLVRGTLGRFLRDPMVEAARARLATPNLRLETFQDPSVRSAGGKSYDWYFGHWEAPKAGVGLGAEAGAA